MRLACLKDDGKFACDECVLRSLLDQIALGLMPFDPVLRYATAAPKTRADMLLRTVAIRFLGVVSWE